MSEKKERSKSKENDQPPKAAKKDKPDAKKDKPDAKSRKSVSKEPSEAKDK